MSTDLPPQAHPLPPSSWARLGAVNWTILLWAIGVPLPIVLIVGLLRGCS